MSDEIKQEVAKNDEGQGQVDVNELVTELNKLRSTNERLLNESKQYKTRKTEVEELKEKLNMYETKKLEEEGNFQEMLRREQEEKSRLQARLKQQSNEILKGNIFNSVANVAKDAHDISDLLAQSDYANMIEVDEESLKPQRESVEKFVSSLREQKPYLFKGKKVAAMADAKASIDKPVNKSLGQMNDNERKEMLRQALSQLN